MSINGVSVVATPVIRPQENARPRVEQEQAGAAASASRTAAQPAKMAGAALLAPRHDALPAEAPEGTDPALWQVLTAAERAHFARMTAMGPLTYGRGAAGGPPTEHTTGETPLLRGGRLDVRA
ncbi:MAG TPA: hypothetical protein VMN39_08350 [Longimicrobiaceae bacterium]|nr:hypothetical protein [Longimicrobiaceae bacterium]